MNRLTKIQLLVTAALLFIVFVGAETRVRFFLEHSNSIDIQDDSSTYISMAANLRHGIGWVNPDDRAAFNADRMGFTPVAADDAHLVKYYSGLDLGYSLVYWVALHTFGLFVPAVLAMIYLQITVDTVNIVLMFWLGYRILGSGLGLTAAAIYAGLWMPVSLNTTYPFYYPWCGTCALWNFVMTSQLLDARFPDESIARRLLLSIAWGVVLGLSSLIRSLFLPLGLMLGALILVRHRRHLRVMGACVAVAIAVQILALSPFYAHNYARYGRFNTRWVWHTAYIGFGAHPNPWGIQWADSEGFKRAARAGLTADNPNWVIRYDEFMRAVVMDMYRQQPALALRNAWQNLSYGVTGEDGALALQWSVAGTITTYNYQLPIRPPPLWSSPSVVIAILLALQSIWFVIIGRRRGDPWTYAAVVLSTAFMVTTISLLCPPYAFYNAGYGPGYALLLGVAAYAVGTGGVAIVTFLRAHFKSGVTSCVAALTFPRTRIKSMAIATVSVLTLLGAQIQAMTTASVALLTFLRAQIMMNEATGIAPVYRHLAWTWFALFTPALAVRHVRVIPHAIETVPALAAVIVVYIAVRLWLHERSARVAAIIMVVGLSLGLALGWNRGNERWVLQLGLPACVQTLQGLFPLLLLQSGAVSPSLSGLIAVIATALHAEMLLMPALIMLVLGPAGLGRQTSQLRTMAVVMAAVGIPLNLLRWWMMESAPLDFASLVAPLVFLVLTALLPRLPQLAMRLPLALVIGAIKLRAYPAWRLLALALAAAWIADRWAATHKTAAGAEAVVTPVEQGRAEPGPGYGAST